MIHWVRVKNVTGWDREETNCEFIWLLSESTNDIRCHRLPSAERRRISRQPTDTCFLKYQLSRSNKLGTFYGESVPRPFKIASRTPVTSYVLSA